MEFPDNDSKAFLDAAPDSIVIVDELGRIAFVNLQAEVMFDYPRAVLIGRPVETLLPERFRDRHRGHLQSYFGLPRRRPMGVGLELLARRRDGAEFPVEISLSPVSTARGLFVSGAIRDVSERKEVEHQLKEARDLAEQANRAKSAFLAAASHDLRQPLQTLTLLSGVLSRAVPSQSRAATAVANQSAALRLMSHLLNSLLDISKLEAGTIQPDISDCAVSNIFAGLRAEFAGLAEAKGLDLIIEDCSDVVRTDPTLLGQIIQNLLGNAIRYTRQGCVRLRALAQSPNLRIEVLDTGIGIPASELELIFNEFYQARRSPGDAREGVGLGLSIVRRIASLLGCELDVSSTVGEGSCFAVHVPRVEAPSGTAEAESLPAVAILAGTTTVLVIDDDEAVADATAMLLGSEGLEVLVARTSEDACNAAREQPPSVLICDYHLGGDETGLDAIRATREVTRSDLPAILVSGDTSSAITKAVRELEDCHLLSKPVDGDRLLELALQLTRR